MNKLKTGLAACLFLLCAATATAQTTDEIVAKYMDAVGGKEAWKKVTAIRQEGIIDQGGTEIAFASLVLNNKGYRQTISFSGMTGYSIYTPTEGWYFFPWQGHQKAEANTPEDVKESQSALDVQGSLFNYKEKGHTAEYVGMDDFEGTDCYKVKLTEKSGLVTTYYIDPSNYLVVHTVTVSKSNGQVREQKTDLANYKKFGDIWLPMNIGTDFKIKKVEINPTVDESLFKVAK